MRHFRGMRVLSAVSAALACAVLLGAPVQAGKPTTRWVDDDGHAGAAGCKAGGFAFKKVQKAIDASAAQDIVVVCPGVYTEDVTVVGKAGLVLRAAVSHKAVIAAPLGSTGPLILVESNGVAIRGLKLLAQTTAGCGATSSGVAVDGTSNTIMFGLLILADPAADTTGPCGLVRGVDIYDGGTASIRNTVIRDFQLDGVRVKDGGVVTVEHSSIEYLRTGDPCAAVCAAGAAGSVSPAGLPQRNGVAVMDATGTVTSTALFSGIDAAHTGIQLQTGLFVVHGTLTATGNTVRRATWGVDVEAADGAVITDNLFRAGLQWGIVFATGTNALVKGNVAKDNGVNGIFLNAPSIGNRIKGNDFRGNVGTDCVDQSVGAGTAGTHNLWKNDKGDEDAPDGICTAS